MKGCTFNVLFSNNSTQANRIDTEQQIDTLLKKISQAESENKVSVLLHLYKGTKVGSVRENSEWNNEIMIWNKLPLRVAGLYLRDMVRSLDIQAGIRVELLQLHIRRNQ